MFYSLKQGQKIGIQPSALQTVWSREKMAVNDCLGARLVRKDNQSQYCKLD